jgi:large subunit ribosomal protein L35
VALRSRRGVGGWSWAARATQSTGATAETGGGGGTCQCRAAAFRDDALHPPLNNSALAQIPACSTGGAGGKGNRNIAAGGWLGGGWGHVVLCLFVPAATRDMPKLKTRKAAAKRFKATGTGKFMRRRAFRSHLLDHKSPKRKRYLGTMALVDERDADNVSAMLPYA